MIATTGLDWVTRLLPERVDERLRQPDDAMLVYQRLTWRDELRADATLDAGIAWEGPAAGGVERALWSRARSGHAVVAEAFLVVRHAGHHTGPSTGPGRPAHPAAPAAAIAAPLVLTDNDIRAFVTEVDGRYPATITVQDAWARGFTGILVPGPLLVRAALGRVLHEPSGEVEAWFLGPVPAGAILSRRRDAGAGVESLHLAGRQRPSVVLQWRTSPPG